MDSRGDRSSPTANDPSASAEYGGDAWKPGPVACARPIIARKVPFLARFLPISYLGIFRQTLWLCRRGSAKSYCLKSEDVRRTPGRTSRAESGKSPPSELRAA